MWLKFFIVVYNINLTKVHHGYVVNPGSSADREVEQIILHGLRQRSQVPFASVSRGSVPSYWTSPSATTGGLAAGASSWRGAAASEGGSVAGG